MKAFLEPFLPVPVVVREGERYRLDWDRPQSVGKIRAFMGNMGVLVRAYTYLCINGINGLQEVARHAVLNANYVMRRLAKHFPPAVDRFCMHECVLTAEPLAKRHGVRAMDVAKALLDYGFHAPTVYFPLPAIVPEALMIEPTETESKETLDAFIAAMEAIAREAQESPDRVRERPFQTPVRRLDEVTAARRPVLRWPPPEGRP
ncbi:MAG: hypothetical protein KatS3mg115_2015 [Candidatus Poribacteria bacterium]|nr:MAG: hypothetical protein KatS3mg115_2015 [Candidatus Poribacteria bacterium]